MNERLSSATDDGADASFLKQSKMKLSEKLELLKKLDEKAIELMSASEDENAERDLEKEIEKPDDLRGELQKVAFEIDERQNLTMPATSAALSPPQNQPR